MSYLRKAELLKPAMRLANLRERRRKIRARESGMKFLGATVQVMPPKLKEGEVHPFRRLIEAMTGWKSKRTLAYEAKLEEDLLKEERRSEREAGK